MARKQRTVDLLDKIVLFKPISYSKEILVDFLHPDVESLEAMAGQHHLHLSWLSTKTVSH
jgi:hypothetical protein